jgi:hypothetical protein
MNRHKHPSEILETVCLYAHKSRLNHLATTTRPLLQCRNKDCNELLFAYYQPGFLPSKPGHWYVECHNVDCKLFMVTLAETNYHDTDLLAYGLSPDAIE